MTHTFALLTMALAMVQVRKDDTPNLEERARALVSMAARENFAAAVKDFDEVMTKVMPEDKFAENWKELVKQVGPLKRLGKVTLEKVQKYDVVWVACEFEKAPIFTRVVFDGEGRVAGLSFRAFGPVGEYKAPAYVRRDSFTESDLRIGEGEWVLPGTLTLPTGNGPFPGVVLVHGSGPNDRDETLGPSKPFRDLAWGLASRGIAVLRYEKRTKEHGAKMAKTKGITIREEVLDDAMAAVAILRKTKGIDGRRVFVAGHSLGAMAAPRLGERDPELAGLVLLAGPSRNMADVLVEQLDYVASVNPSPEQKAAVEKLKVRAAKLKDPKLSPETPATELPFDAEAIYWISLFGLAPVETALKIRQPLLILQGGRDYQSTMEDFEGWKKALSGRKSVTLKSYAKLNHLFVEGEGKAKPEEYLKEGHVAAEVVDDIASWVLGVSGK